ncbi:hypothetical protein [uncultured Sulfitobacter sp.]|uniref:hypothetical protein n=1 Tax=uncultured Sulfitobacter sp. TaxID=191468 RepID=UPI00262C55D8|nr:hypothetical protein [uncultured Sulfitobacter sp.]
MHRVTVASLALCLFTAACNTAGPDFRGLPATTVTVDGSTFDVRVRDELAEAIRTTPEYAPRFGPIRARAARAMAMVSGCEVREVRGDQAQATGILDCGKNRRRPAGGAPAGLACATVTGSALGALGGSTVALDCAPL